MFLAGRLSCCATNISGQPCYGLHERREEIDFLILIEELRTASHLEGIGGGVYHWLVS